MKIRIVSIDIWADYGHFKRFYTTASPITFSIPPITAVYGIVGALAGFSKDSYINRLNSANLKAAVVLKNRVKKFRMGVNWIETKYAKGPGFNLIKERTQIRLEYLKNPCYTLFITAEDESFLTEFANLVKVQRCIYTPCLGISECIASFCFDGELEGEVLSAGDDYIEIDSVLPVFALSDKPNGIAFESGKKYSKERIPIKMAENRQVTQYEDVIFEVNCQTIKCRPSKYVRTSDERNLLFMP